VGGAARLTGPGARRPRTGPAEPEQPRRSEGEQLRCGRLLPRRGPGRDLPGPALGPGQLGGTLVREASRILARGVLVTDFGAVGLRFARGHVTRGFVAVPEPVGGPRHAADALGYLSAGGLGSLAEGSGLAVTTTRHFGGGSITIAVLELAG
jgi:hypothetical protein